MPAKSAGEEESDLEHHRKSLDEQVERPFLEPIKFALRVSTTPDRRFTRMSQVLIQSLLSQNRNECGQEKNQEARIQESGGSDNPTRSPLNARNDRGLVYGWRD